MLCLNCHSVYTYKCAIGKIKDIASAIKDDSEFNQTLCITDVDSFSSIKKASEIAKSNGLKLIPGYEARLKPIDEHNSFLVSERKIEINKKLRLKRTTAEEKAVLEKELESMSSTTCSYHSIVMLSTSNVGFKNLIHLFNSETLQEDYYVLESNLFETEDLTDIIMLNGIDGDIGFYLKIGDQETACYLIEYYKNIFKNNFYIQIDATSILDNAFEINQQLIDLANKFDVKYVIANNIRYVKKEERNEYRLYRNIVSGDIERYTNDNDYIMTCDETKAFLTNLGYSKNQIDIMFTSLSEIDSKSQNFEFPTAPSLINCEQQLRDLCEKGWNKLRKGTKYEKESRERFEYELSIINGKNFSQYFIKIYNIVRTAYEQGILMGPGRGSGGGSEICYLLGIIKIDPLKYGLLFERFLNPERKNFPDIDLDFATLPLGSDYTALTEEDETNENIFNVEGNKNSRELIMSTLVKNGDFKFAHYITNEVNTSTLTLFKALAKYYEIPFFQVNKISTNDIYAEKLAEKTYSGWLKEAVDMFGFYWEDYWDRVEKYMPFCYKYNKSPAGTSVAASGVIMGDEIPILPLQDNAFRLNGVDLEASGYIKYDLLSVNTLNQIVYFEGLDTDWNDTEDEAVWDMIDSGDTDYCFQFSSPGMKRIIEETRPRDITQLAEINALYRPGPLNAGYVDKYIALKKAKIEGKQIELSSILTKEEIILHDLLQSIFGKDHVGLPIFQEDIMKICQYGCGFSLAEADDIRKAMGKKKMELLESYRPRFVKDWKYDCDAEAVWKAIVGFGAYAFNKSHSVAYAIVGYKTAKIWHYHQDQYLEFSLNYDTKARYALAMEKIKQLRYKYTYPTIQNMEGSLFAVRNKTLFIPGHAERNYDSYVDFLFGDTKDLYNLIYKGVCDSLTKDRYALVDLIDNCSKTVKENALYMEPVGEKFTKITQILDGLKLIGFLTWTKDDSGDIIVKIPKRNGKIYEIKFHRDSSNYNRSQNLTYDLKQFGTIRKNILSDEPYINTSAIENILNRTKQKAYESGKGKQAYYLMKDRLNDYMREYFYNTTKGDFHDVYAMLIDVKAYDRSTKITLEFNDKQEIYYVSGANAKKVSTMQKKSLLRLFMKFSPFIQRRTEKFIYDFDIMEIEELKPEE